MKMLLTISIVIVGLLAIVVTLVLVIGSQLSPTHVATKSVVVVQPPSVVYAVVRDFKSAPLWRSGVKAVEVTTLANGKTGFREVSSQDSVDYEVVEDIPGERLVTQIVNTDLGYSGSWTYEFKAEGNGTRVTITENGEVSNILFRFMSRFVFGHTSTIDAYLGALIKRMERA